MLETKIIGLHEALKDESSEEEPMSVYRAVEKDVQRLMDLSTVNKALRMKIGNLA